MANRPLEDKNFLLDGLRKQPILYWLLVVKLLARWNQPDMFAELHHLGLAHYDIYNYPHIFLLALEFGSLDILREIHKIRFTSEMCCHSSIISRAINHGKNKYSPEVNQVLKDLWNFQ